MKFSQFVHKITAQYLIKSVFKCHPDISDWVFRMSDITIEHEMVDFFSIMCASNCTCY